MKKKPDMKKQLSEKNQFRNRLFKYFHFGETEFRKKIAKIIEDQPESKADAREKELINNILNISNISASDIMTSRGEIVGIDASQDLEKILDLIANNPHSRYPLYEEHLDNVMGTIHTKSVYQWLRKTGGKTNGKQGCLQVWKKLIYKPSYVAPSMPVLDLLLNMREGRNHIAFVVDEYGGIAGLVTIEDALEKIVGSIEDEHDIVANDNGISYYKNNSAIINGRYKLEELENKFGKLLNDAQRQENLDTVGGLVIYLAGRVPAKGELIPWKINELDVGNKQILKNKKNIEFEILQSLPNRIVEVQLHGLDLRKKSQK